MSDELFRKYRPQKFSQVFGQPKAVKQLRTALKADSLPHQLLFTGSSGNGKTTLARILKPLIGCSNRDFSEYNCADFRGIDLIRDIRKTLSLFPLGGETKIVLIDECHQLTKDAQNALLKMLEEPPDHFYFMLATTEAGKLLKTIQTRCTEVPIVPMTPEAVQELLAYVLEQEERTLTSEVTDKIVECCEQSARKALVILQTVLGLEDEEEQIQAIIRSSSSNQAIEIARGLINPKMSWPEMSKILKGVDEEPESIRRMVLSYAANCLLGTGTAIHARAYMILIAFSENYFDTGRAGLVASCFEVLSKTR